MYAFETYDFEAAVTAAYSHWLYEFCDVYLELVKPRLNSILTSEKRDLTPDERAAIDVMYIVMERGLRILHPLIPFITEELWQRLTSVEKVQKTTSERDSRGIKSISQCDYPQQVSSWDDAMVESEYLLFMQVVKHFRSTLAQFEVPPKMKLAAFLKVSDERVKKDLESKAGDIVFLAKLQSVAVVDELDGHLITSVINDVVTSGLDPNNAIEFKSVEKKFLKRLAELDAQIDKISQKCTAPDYEAKVPQEIQVKDKESITSYKTEEKCLKAALDSTHRFLKAF